MENVREVPFEVVKKLARIADSDDNISDLVIMATAGELVPVDLISRVIDRIGQAPFWPEFDRIQRLLGDILDAEI